MSSIEKDTIDNKNNNYDNKNNDGTVKESNTNNNNRGSNEVGDYYQQVLQSAAIRLKNNMAERKTNNGSSLYEKQKMDEELLLQSLPQRPVANFPSEDDRKRIVGCLASILSLASAHESQHFETNHVHSDYSSHDDTMNGDSTTTTTTGTATDQNQDEIASLLPSDNNNNNNNNGVSSSFYSLKPSEKDKEQIIHQHLRRRHDVYSNFLVRSTELLFLDKSHAYAFLPILSRLLLSPHNKLNNETCAQFSTRRDSMTNSKQSSDSSFKVEEQSNSFRSTFSKSSASSRSVEWGQFQTADGEHTCCETSHTTHNDDDDYAHPLQDHFESLHCNGNMDQSQNNKDESSKHDKVHTYSFPKNNISIKELNSKLSLADYLYNSSDEESRCDSSDEDHNISSIQEVKVPQHEQEDKPIHDKTVEHDTKQIDSSNGTSDIPTVEVPKPKKTKKRPKQKEEPSSNQLATTWYNNPLLQPFLESITPGAGMQCVSFLLLQHLLRNSSEGYDARIRHVLKKLAIVIFMHESKPGSNKNMESETELALHATRKFEALEHGIARRLLHLSGAEHLQRNEEENQQQNVKERQLSKESSAIRINRDAIVRGLKIGSAGVVAGTLFAVTGGLAAPGIAAGLAALGTTTAASAAVMTTLTSTATVTTIFGVGGGSLYAYKTHRRTQGLTEFEFTKESVNTKVRKSQKERKGEDAELFTTICLAGWLQDNRDFQRPWGVTPTSPPIDRLEKLERFYLIHKPENIKRCSRILHQWKKEERQLWQFLRKKYGRDPDHLFPLNNGPRKMAALTHEEEEGINLLLNELGYFVERKQKETYEETNQTYSLPIQKLRSLRRTNSKSSDSVVAAIPHATSSHSSLRNLSSQSANTNESIKNLKTDENEKNSTNEANTAHKIKRQVGATTKVWDYFSEFGGELYTVKWESNLLMELCDSVVDVAVDLVHGAAREVLKQTALATLLTAVALPYALVQAASMIDGTWTLAIERADEAGIELARTLLESQAGHRPVVLVGFSMGARTIYSCLKELARHQRRWEEQHMTVDNGYSGSNKQNSENDTTKTSNDDDTIQYRREPASIVEDAILMGTPNHLSVDSWELCRQVVAGRLVNCFSRKDLILSLMFQFKRLALRSVCGTSPVNVTGVEDVDVSHLISSHSDYCFMSGDILRLVGHGQPSYKNAFYNTTESNSNDIVDDTENVNLLEKLDEGIPTISKEERQINVSALDNKSINSSSRRAKRTSFFSSLSSEACEY